MIDADCDTAGSEVTEMCDDRSTRTVQSGHLVTPHYPDVYPANSNCLCRLQVDRPAARLRLTFYDLALETRNGRCQADWIMLRQKGTLRRSAVYTAGIIVTWCTYHLISFSVSSVTIRHLLL